VGKYERNIRCISYGKKTLISPVNKAYPSNKRRKKLKGKIQSSLDTVKEGISEYEKQITERSSKELKVNKVLMERHLLSSEKNK
jgi:ElaB/YqjD/DUF883 family membrane-anchored ribosome-binding protein